MTVKTIMEKWDDGLSWEWIWDFFFFTLKKFREWKRWRNVNKYGLIWIFWWMYEDEDEDGEGRRWRNVNKIIYVEYFMNV